MTQVYMDLVNGEWKEVEKSNFWIDRYLLNKLQSLEKIQQDGWDGVIIVDGKERSGKSVLAMVMGWYLSKGKLCIDNFARGLTDAAHKISVIPDRSVIIVDEASTVFAAKDTMTEATKQLIKIMDVVGQKNLIFILCLPSFFDLAKTIAVRRSLFLCHVYPDDNYKRGSYSFFGEKTKKQLYILGKRNFDSYSYPQADFVGKYLDFKPPFYQEYLEVVKKESLQQVLKAATSNEGRWDVTKAVAMTEGMFYGWLKEHLKWTNEQLTAIKGESDSSIATKIRLFKSKKADLGGMPLKVVQV